VSQADIESRLQFVSNFVYRGHGIGLLRQPTVTKHSRAVHSYAVTEVGFPQIPVFAVYSNRKFLPLRLNVFLEALAAWKGPLWLRE